MAETEKKTPIRPTARASEHRTDLKLYLVRLGLFLRTARIKNGLSLRGLGHYSGVRHTEIFKIEAGQQECRLESFIRLCCALGIPPGRLLDDVVSSSFAYFQNRVAADPQFEVLKEELNISGHAEARSLSCDLGGCCAVVACLARCCNPVRKAASIEYPNAEMRGAFLKYASWLDGDVEPLDRSGIIFALARNPIAELRNHQLLDRAFLRDRLRKHRAHEAYPIWSPPLPFLGLRILGESDLPQLNPPPAPPMGAMDYALRGESPRAIAKLLGVAVAANEPDESIIHKLTQYDLARLSGKARAASLKK